MRTLAFSISARRLLYTRLDHDLPSAELLLHVGHYFRQHLKGEETRPQKTRQLTTCPSPGSLSTWDWSACLECRGVHSGPLALELPFSWLFPTRLVCCKIPRRERKRKAIENRGLGTKHEQARLE